MKAILINTETETVENVLLPNTHKDICDLIGCRTFTVAHYLENNDCIYVNDAGMFSNPEKFFAFQGAHQPFAGNAVIVGSDFETGNTVDCKSTATDIWAKTEFLSVIDVIKRLNN